MNLRVYKHIVTSEQFLGAFPQTMNAAIFIRAYHKEHPGASLYVHAGKRNRYIPAKLHVDEINTHLVELTAAGG